nr:alcohol dehydrogenase catalytic domain-containing protein [Actinomycetales bacterium]
MKGIVLTGFKTFPEIQELEKPTAGPGEVVLKVAGSGACHSDVALFHDYESDPTGKLTPPYVLGHEVSGWVEEVGPGVNGLEIGSAHLVYGPIGCQRCRACSRGQDTYCENVAQMDYMATGLGKNGGMAEYVVVPARNLVPLGDADPINAAPLADAGLTPYHAIKSAMPVLTGGGKTALVIGLGGLGYIAVQMLSVLTGAKILVTDMKEDAMKAVEQFGGIPIAGGEGQADRVREATGGRGVDAVFDFVGISPTIELAMSVVSRQGAAVVVGVAGHPYEWSFYKAPYEARLYNTYWGTIEELYDVVALYRDGKITPNVERYSLEGGLEAYQKLVDGTLSARAVIVPHGEV